MNKKSSMSNKLYNLIMNADPEFWSGNAGYIDFPRSRFLEYTADHLKNKFQSLGKNAIIEIKSLPTLFATEHEYTETKIGKITNIETMPRNLRIYYQFSEDHYPLTKGVLQQNWQNLNIDKRGLEFYRTHWAIKEADISIFYKEYLRSIPGIAQKLKAADKKVQLIYGFNGSGKTRLSIEFKELFFSKIEEESELSRTKILCYNAFIEDLFYWENDTERKLKIHPNNYTQWVLREQGQERNVTRNFQRYTSDKLTPDFSADFAEVTFTFARGNEEQVENIKISKGEESNFIWSIFYTLIEEVVEVLKFPEAEDRGTDQFDNLEYVFIDDPVSSLDENHLIELAVNLSELIKNSQSGLKFIITTHNPLFYNVLHNELDLKKKSQKEGCYLLEKLEDGAYNLNVKYGDSNKSFSYHLYIRKIIEKAIADNQIEKFHFMLLRNLYEKTASFLGYAKWQDLLETVPGDKDAYLKRIITFSSHSTLSSEEVRDLTEPEKQIVKFLFNNLIDNYGYWSKQEDKNAGTN